MQTGDIGADVTGILLAGGRSSRMGGREKALLELAGRPMLQHVADRFCPQVARAVINANGDSARFAGFALPVVADGIAGQPGPLAGLLTGMAWAQRETPSARFIATAPADCPFLPRDLIARLMAALTGSDSPCAIAATGGQRHPVAGLWRLELAAAAADALAQNMRALHRFADAQGCAVAQFSPLPVGGTDVDPFFNVNTPEDLERAEMLLGTEDVRA